MRHGLGGQVSRRSLNDLEAARSCLAFLKEDTDLDKRLTGAVAAECTAFNCLVDSKLSEAVRYSMWCEWASLSQLPVRIRTDCLAAKLYHPLQLQVLLAHV